jgi:hypothetical protein
MFKNIGFSVKRFDFLCQFMTNDECRMIKNGSICDITKLVTIVHERLFDDENFYPMLDYNTIPR